MAHSAESCGIKVCVSSQLQGEAVAESVYVSDNCPLASKALDWGRNSGGVSLKDLHHQGSTFGDPGLKPGGCAI